MLTASNEFKAAILPGITSFRKTAARVTINATSSTDAVDTIGTNSESSISVLANVIDPDNDGQGYEAGTASGPDGGYVKTIPPTIYAGGYASDKVYQILASDMSSLDVSDSYGDAILAMATDGSNIYTAGDFYTVCKYSPDGMTKLGETADLGDSINGLVCLGGFIYALAFNVVKKIDTSDMSYVSSSAAYGTVLYSIITDGTYIYAGGHYAIGKIFKYDPSDLSKLAESTAYGNIWAMATDGTYIYAAGSTTGSTYPVYQFNLSDMAKNAESASYGGMVNGLTHLDGYLYAGGYTVKKVFKYDVSDMSKVAESADSGDTLHALTNDGTYIYASCGSTNKNVIKYAASDLAVVDQSASSGDTLRAIAYLAEISETIVQDCLFAGGSVAGKIWGINEADMVDFLWSPTYSAKINALANDGTYVYAAVAGVGKVYKFDPTDMSKVAESAAYGGEILALTCFGTHIYAAGATTQRVFQILTSDMSKVAESADYGGTIYALCNDGASVFAGGAGDRKIFQYAMTDMSKTDESPAYTGYILALTCDATHVYAAGNNRIVYKVLISDMSAVSNSGDYGGIIYSLVNNGSYVYAGGATTQTVWKIQKSDMAKTAESTLTLVGGTVFALETDGTYVYAAIGEHTHAVVKYLVTDMSVVDQSRVHDGDMCALTLGIEYTVVKPTITLNYVSGISSPGLTIYFDGVYGALPTDFTVQVLNGSTVLQTITVTGNTKNYFIIDEYLNEGLAAADKIVITFITMSGPYERVRVARIHVGIEQEYSEYGDEGFYKLTTIHESDHTCLTLPAGEARVLVDNISGDYNPFVPVGFAAWLQVGAIMAVKMGVYVAGVRELVKTGTYWFAEWQEVGYKQVELIGKDSIGYYGELPALANAAGWTVGSNVETYIGDVLSWAGIPSSYYNVTPFPGADNAFMAGPTADLVLDELRLMAQWLMKICVCDANGVIQFIDADVASVSSLDLDDCYEMPVVDRSALVGSVDVNIYTATLGASDEVIAIHKETFTGAQVISVWVGWDFGDLSVVVAGAASNTDTGFSYGYYLVTPVGTGAEVTVTVSGKRYNIAKTVYTLVNSSAAGSRENKITIDNPHICTRALAASVATWTLANLNKLLKLTYNWRGNPILEPLDMITAETTHGNKNIIITRQDLEFDGVLSGRIEGVF